MTFSNHAQPYSNNITDYVQISMLRSANTQARQFRSILKAVTYHLGYEATATLTTREIQVSVSLGKEAENGHIDCTGHKIDDKVCLIPILRSGLGMADGMLELLPQAAVHHIGMYHVPGVAPVQYFNRLPRKCESDVAYIVDPVIGSAETAMATIAILKKVRCFRSFVNR
jgi:uracil phosphoribosyltransferase